jgi:hypothetical protein
MLLALTAALATACTKANPAFRGVSRGADDGAAEGQPPGAAEAGIDDPMPPLPDPADAASAPDLAGEPDLAAAPDLAAPADSEAPTDLAPPPPDTLSLNPDLPAPDLAPDVARDLTPDLAPPIAGLIAHLKFDEAPGTMMAADATGNLNAGRPRGAVFLRNGGFPAAKFTNQGLLSLDGQDDYLDITNRNLPRNQDAKTISVWIKATSPAGLPIRTVVSLADDSSEDRGLQLGLDGGRCATWIFGSFTPLVTGKTIDTNWHHVAVTLEGSKHTLYCDGTNVTTGNHTPSTGTITTPRVGTWQAPEEMFHGYVDDLRIYGRALTAAEVQILAGGGE